MGPEGEEKELTASLSHYLPTAAYRLSAPRREEKNELPFRHDNGIQADGREDGMGAHYVWKHPSDVHA